MFKFVKSLSGENFPLQREIPASANNLAADATIALTNGEAVIAGGTTKPLYVSAGKSANDKMPVQDVLPHFIWETEWTAAATAINVGDKVTLAATGLGVTATTTSGVAEVVEILGTAIGDKVHVKF